MIRALVLTVIFLALAMFVHNHPGDMITTWLATIGAFSICIWLYWLTVSA
jgi:hypothetical protein